ncbi:DLG1 protein, partial [Eudromia elegans]|nr:DLG1 protein [Eudromia elegans]
DTERAVEILSRYQSTLRSPEEQELKASIGRVSHIFQSELFQALLGESRCPRRLLRPPGPSPGARAARPGSRWVVEPSMRGVGTLCRAAEQGPGPRLVRVTARRTEAPASVCNLLLGARAALPQVRL